MISLGNQARFLQVSKCAALTQCLIPRWRVEDFTDLGPLIRGVASGDLSKIKPLIFKRCHSYCRDELSSATTHMYFLRSAILGVALYTGIPPQTIEAMANKAISVFGAVASWDSAQWGRIHTIAKVSTLPDTTS